MGPKSAFALNALLLHKDILRKYICGTLKEKFLCSACRTKCDKCGGNVVYHQKREHCGMCLQCSPIAKRCPPGALKKKR